MKGLCPTCEGLVGISPTGEKHHPDRTSTYWRVDVHARDGRVCEGSGRKI